MLDPGSLLPALGLVNKLQMVQQLIYFLTQGEIVSFSIGQGPPINFGFVQTDQTDASRGPASPMLVDSDGSIKAAVLAELNATLLAIQAQLAAWSVKQPPPWQPAVSVSQTPPPSSGGPPPGPPPPAAPSKH